MASDEIERFRREIVARTGDVSVPETRSRTRTFCARS